MPIFADQTIYAGVITLVTLTGVFAGIIIAVVQRYRMQHSDYRIKSRIDSPHPHQQK